MHERTKGRDTARNVILGAPYHSVKIMNLHTAVFSR